MTARTPAERRTDRAVATATLLMDLADTAGVSESPSAVRYRLARILGAELSRAALDHLHDALIHDAARKATP